MTIIIGLKVNEGILLGSDSATTIEKKIFYKRCKIFNYLNKLPIGFATYGDFEIKNIPLSTIIKEHEEN